MEERTYNEIIILKERIRIMRTQISEVKTYIIFF